MDFKEKLAGYVSMINHALENYLAVKDTPEKTVYEAMRYSLMAGGKRLRPVLALAVCETLGGRTEDVIPYACAVEMIHTYSLIHDDLPAMDNDDYRRGRLTNHKVYGEAMAILAGDALLNYAFEIMLEHAASYYENMPAGTKAMSVIAKASGVSGMIGGQVVDLESEGKTISGQLLEYMHRCKTGALIKAPVLASAALCNASEEDTAALDDFAQKIGLAFQIKDDILDVEGSLDTMGKKSGSDAANNKSTFVTLYGLDQSKKMLAQITDGAIGAIGRFGEKGCFLKDLAQYLLRRES